MLDKNQRRILMWSTVALFAINSVMTGYFYMSESGLHATMNSAMDGVATISLIGEKSASLDSDGKREEIAQHPSTSPLIATESSKPQLGVATHEREQKRPEKSAETFSSQHEKSMMAEQPPSLHEPVAEHATPAQPEISSMAKVMICYQSGPFDSRSLAKKMHGEVSQLGIKAKIRKQIKTKKLGFWVYLKPERSLALSRLKAEEVKTKGIKDVAVVVKSKPKYAISLGVFHNKNTAEARKIKAESLGFKPLMTTRYNSVTEYWVNMRVPHDQEPSEAQWRDLIKNKKGIEIKPMECKP